ncbi:MAG: hypothetical protein J2P15_23365, partial [Micromonosporaceae bacterium]|nr:hypothetical protein [Micromonosporaceae bacterium]
MALTGVAPDESELLNKINDLIQRLKAKIAELGDVISRNIGRLSSYLQQKVREGWSRFTTTMQSFWDFLAEVLRNMGSPWRLWATADAWSNQIGGPVSA